MPPAYGTQIATRRQPAAFRTLFTTEARYDAGTAGFDHACEPGRDGGFAVHFDGRGSIPSVIINGDGEVQVCGLEAMRALSDALLDALKLGERQS